MSTTSIIAVKTAYCSNCRGEVKDIDLPKCCPECGARMNAPGKEG